MKRQFLFVSILSVSIVIEISAQGVIPTDRQGDWKKAGYSQGQRYIQRIQNTVDASGMHGDALQQAINDQTIPTTYIFPAGTFYFNPIVIVGKSGIILRGAGSNQTRLWFTSSGSSGNLIDIHSSSDIGIENLEIDKVGGASDGSCNISFDNCSSCWVYGIESYFPKMHHIVIGGSSYIVVRGCYLFAAGFYGEHDTDTPNEHTHGYGVCVVNGSHHCLIEDNILRHLRHGISFSWNANNNVAGYNYVLEGTAYQEELGGIQREYKEQDIICHGSGNYANLFEGNVVDLLGGDNNAGNSGYYDTFFRNVAYGTQGMFDEDVHFRAMPRLNIVGNVITEDNEIIETYNEDCSEILDIYGFGTGGAAKSHYQHCEVNDFGDWNDGTNPYEGGYRLNDFSYYYTESQLAPGKVYSGETPDFWDSNVTWPAIGPRPSMLWFGARRPIQKNPAKLRWELCGKLTVDSPPLELPQITLSHGRFVELQASGGNYKVNGIDVGSSWNQSWPYGQPLTIEAIVPAGVSFYKWSDNSREIQRTFKPKGDISLYAIYKSYRISNNLTPTRGNGQQRIASIENGNKDVIVYSSAGEIWTATYDYASTTWTGEVCLSDGLGGNSEPSIAARGICDDMNIFGDGIYVVWQKQNASGAYDVYFAMRNFSDVGPPPAYSGWITKVPSTNDYIKVNAAPCTIPPKPVVGIYRFDGEGTYQEFASIFYNQSEHIIRRQYAFLNSWGGWFDAYFYPTYAVDIPRHYEMINDHCHTVSQPEIIYSGIETITIAYEKEPEIYLGWYGCQLSTMDSYSYGSGVRCSLGSSEIIPAGDFTPLINSSFDYYGNSGFGSPQVVRRSGKTYYAWTENQFYDDNNHYMVVYQERNANGTWSPQWYVWETPASAVTLGVNGTQSELMWSVGNTIYRAFKDGGTWQLASIGMGHDPQISYMGSSDWGAFSWLDYCLYSQSGPTLQSIKIGEYTPSGGLSKATTIVAQTNTLPSRKRNAASIQSTSVPCDYSRIVTIRDTSGGMLISISISQPKLGKRFLEFNPLNDTLPEINAANCLQYLSPVATVIGEDDDTLSFEISIQSKNIKNALHPLEFAFKDQNAMNKVSSPTSIIHNSRKGFSRHSIRTSMSHYRGLELRANLSGLDFSVMEKNLQFSLTHVYKPLTADTVQAQKSVEEISAKPTTTNLFDNFPNPFNPTTSIEYQLTGISRVTLKVYDMLGREVATLTDGIKDAGYYSATFDGARLASGVYIMRLTATPEDGAKPFVQVKKMLLMK